MDKYIEDAGKVLEGAAKHKWGKLAVFTTIDFSIVADFSKTKDFPKFDFEKLLANGIPQNVICAIVAAEKSIPRKSARFASRWNKSFAETAAFVQALMAIEGTITDSDVLSLCDGSFGFNGLKNSVKLSMQVGYPLCAKLGKADILFNFNDGYGSYTKFGVLCTEGRLLKPVCLSDTFEGAVELLREHLKAKVPSKGKKAKGAPKKYQLFRCNSTGDIFIGLRTHSSNVIRVVTGFKDTADASRYLADNPEKVDQAYSAKIPDDNFGVEGIEQRFGKDWLSVRAVEADDILELCNFRGVQYGNYVPQKERAGLNYIAYNALSDLADLLDLPLSAIGFDGDLGLAFGARGKGGHNAALAHFEPVAFNINLTRTKGVGSFAHEWFHALDSYYGAGALTGARNHMKTHAMASDWTLKLNNKLPIKIKNAFADLHVAISLTGQKKRSEALDMYRSKPYWATTIELFARAFEVWVSYELEKKGYVNTFLVGVNKSREDCEHYPYPTRKEFDAGLSEAFWGLINAIEEDESVFCLGKSDFRLLAV